MELDEKLGNRLARRAGIWAGVSVVLFTLAIAVAGWIVRASISGFETAAAEQRERVTEAEAAKVSASATSLAQAYGAALVAERDAIPHGPKAYEAAKRTTASSDKKLAAAIQTRHEQEIYSSLNGNEMTLEMCGDYVYESYASDKPSDCVVRLPDSDIKASLAR